MISSTNGAEIIDHLYAKKKKKSNKSLLIPPNVKTNLNKDIHVKVKIIKLLELKIYNLGKDTLYEM